MLKTEMLKDRMLRPGRDFQLVPGRTLEEHRVISRLIGHRPFMFRASRLPLPAAILCRPHCPPKTRPGFHSPYARQKRPGRIIHAFILQPFGNLHPAGESQRRQQRLVKRRHLRQIRNPQVDVVISWRQRPPWHRSPQVSQHLAGPLASAFLVTDLCCLGTGSPSIFSFASRIRLLASAI